MYLCSFENPENDLFRVGLDPNDAPEIKREASDEGTMVSERKRFDTVIVSFGV
jgi:hypothetical protein